MIIVSFGGLNLFLMNFSFSSRNMMGVSAVIGISCFYLSHIFVSKLLKGFLILFLCLLCLSFANVSLTAGNAMHHQNTYEEIIATMLLSDLEEQISKLPNPPKSPKIAIIGQRLKTSPLTYKAFEKYPIIRGLAVSYTKENSRHSYSRLKSLGFNFDFYIIPEQEKKFVLDSQTILNRRIYDIYIKNNDKFIIRFKR